MALPLNGLLQRAYNLPETEIATLYKVDETTGESTGEFVDNAQEILLRWDAERIAKLQKPADVDQKAIYDKAAQETQARIEKRHEAMLRTLFPQADPEGKLKGDELRTAVNAAAASQKTYNPDDIKRTPEYLELERAANERYEALQDAHASELEKVKTQYEQTQRWSENEKEIRAIFRSSGAVLPSDKARAQRQEDDFVQKFKGFDFQKQSDGRTLPLLDGKRLEDAHGNALYLDTLVLKTAADYFDIQKQDTTANAGNDNGGRATITIKFKDENDFLDRYTQEADPAKQQEMEKAWEAQQQV